MWTEQELIDKLRFINKSLTDLERSTNNIIRHKFHDAYWIGRREAYADLRDKIGDLKEFIEDGETASTASTTGTASTAVNTKTQPST